MTQVTLQFDPAAFSAYNAQIINQLASLGLQPTQGFVAVNYTASLVKDWFNDYTEITWFEAMLDMDFERDDELDWISGVTFDLDDNLAMRFKLQFVGA